MRVGQQGWMREWSPLPPGEGRVRAIASTVDAWENSPNRPHLRPLSRVRERGDGRVALASRRCFKEHGQDARATQPQAYSRMRPAAVNYPRIAVRSSSGVVMGQCCTSRPEPEHRRRDEGRQARPRRMFLMPRCSSVSRMATAFCSYQTRTIESGRSFTPHLKASARQARSGWPNRRRCTGRCPAGAGCRRCCRSPAC